MRKVFIKSIFQPNCHIAKTDMVVINSKDNQRFTITCSIDTGYFNEKGRKIYARFPNRNKETIENYIVDLENAGYLEIESY